MCGISGLASNTIRFQTEKRDVPPSKIVTQSCLVKMSHTYEFSQSPNKSLRPALVSIYDEQICSDLQILVNKQRLFKVNKCILAVRSQPLAAMITKVEHMDNPTVEVQCIGSMDLFELLLRWLYSASIEIPHNIFQVAQLFFMA
jgi:speckle-type POZ protein